MGWIGGVVGAWQSCLSEANQTKNSHQNSLSDSYFLEREIEREMYENNCITLEEKRSYLLRISMFDMKHMPYRRGVIQVMLNDIEWKMQEEHQKETQNIKLI